MPTNIDDSAATFTDPVVGPADGDAVTGSAPSGMGQDLAERTRYLKNRLTSGTYTPTISGETNCGSGTVNGAFYTRTDGYITVHGSVSNTYTGAGAKYFTIDLPVDPGANFTGTFDAIGSGTAYSVAASASESVVVGAIASSKTVSIETFSADTSGTRAWFFSFTYAAAV